MENFIFQCTTKLIFGKGSEKQVGAEVRQYGSNILLVHYGDEFIKKSGILQQVTESLTESGVSYIELSGIKPNPLLERVYDGIKICRENNISFILAIGGGSVIDTAKAIAVGVLYKGDVWDLFQRKDTFSESLPVGCIVTIPATGSEESTGSVITNGETHYKLDINQDILRPKFAIMNPEMTYTLPRWQTFCGAADIMSHVLERYFTNVSDVDLTDRLCEGTLKSVIRSARILLKDPSSYAARAEIMLSSTVAHNDMLSTGRIGDWGSHMIGHEISAMFDTTHGAALTIVLPAWMRYVYKDNLNRFVQFAIRVWDVDNDVWSPERTALEGIRRTEEFFREIGLPVRLADLKINADDLVDEMAAKVTERGPVGNFKKLYKEDVLTILKMAK